MRVERIQPDFAPMEDISKPARDSAGAVLQQVEAKNEQLDGREKQISKETLETKVRQLNQTLEIFNRKFHFKIHEETRRVVVQVLRLDTGELISEIPPEKVLDMVADMEKAVGLIIDAKV